MTTAPVPAAPPEPPFPALLSTFRADPLSLAGRVPGVWPVWKPSGPTSHDLVARARRSLGLRRVGHAGTLDPMAEGVLVLLAGNAARLFDEFQSFPKRYRARLRWNLRTDTQDTTGRPLDGESFRPAQDLTPTEVETALAAFRGEILQTPPMYSALKRDGRPLHEWARRGVECERTPRPATVYDLTLAAFNLPDGEAELLMTVASGFYVRTLIDDLGNALGVGAAMSALTREAIGPFDRATCLALPPAPAAPPRPPRARGDKPRNPQP